MTLVSSFLEFVQQVSFVMTAPTFDTFVTVLTGWVFARRHTVTGAILAADAVGAKHHSSFHRLFAKAEWRLDEFGLAVFALIDALLPDDTVMLAVDDTLARKRGLKIHGVGMHHDPLISTRKVARIELVPSLRTVSEELQQLTEEFGVVRFGTPSDSLAARSASLHALVIARRYDAVVYRFPTVRRVFLALGF